MFPRVVMEATLRWAKDEAATLIALFVSTVRSPGSIGKEYELGAPAGALPRLVVFVAVSVIVAHSINRTLYGAIGDVRLDKTLVVTLVFWVAFAAFEALVCSLIPGSKSAAITMQATLQILAALYVLNSAATLVISIPVVLVFTLFPDIFATLWSLDAEGKQIVILFTTYTVLHTLSFGTYEAMAMRRIHGLNAAQTGLVVVTTLLGVFAKLCIGFVGWAVENEVVIE